VYRLSGWSLNFYAQLGGYGRRVCGWRQSVALQGLVSKLTQCIERLAILPVNFGMLVIVAHAVALSADCCQSLARRRHWPSPAKVRATTQRRRGPDCRRHGRGKHQKAAGIGNVMTLLALYLLARIIAANFAALL
jgi:hypothetical protein